MRKTTNIELAEELEAIDPKKYGFIIARARDYLYHDVLKPYWVEEPKVKLISDLYQHPELVHIREAVIKGDYNEGNPEEEIRDIECEIIN